MIINMINRIDDNQLMLVQFNIIFNETNKLTNNLDNSQSTEQMNTQDETNMKQVKLSRFSLSIESMC